MARRLVLIRHSTSDVQPDVVAARWSLSADGEVRARAFAMRIDPGTASRVCASPEPKAVQTAQALGDAWGLTVEQVPGLQEHERPEPRMFPRAEFESRVGEMFARPGERVFGAETADEARRRFTKSVLGLVQRTAEDVVIVTHGTVMALFVAACTGADAFAFWRRLRMPCAVTLSLPELALERLTFLDDDGHPERAPVRL